VFSFCVLTFRGEFLCFRETCLEIQVAICRALGSSFSDRFWSFGSHFGGNFLMVGRGSDGGLEALWALVGGQKSPKCLKTPI
jgi:hypothetical protein